MEPVLESDECRCGGTAKKPRSPRATPSEEFLPHRLAFLASRRFDSFH